MPNAASLDHRLATLEEEVRHLRHHRQEAEQEAAYFRQFYDQAPLSYHTLDANDQVIAVNDSWLSTFGYRKEEVLGRTFFEFLPNEERDHFSHALRRLKERGKPQKTQLAIQKKDKSYLHLTLNACRHRDRQGHYRETHCILQPSPEQEQLAKSQRQRDQEELSKKFQHVQKLESLGILAGGIAHDFNNLLMVVIGNADLALLDLSPLSPARENLTEIKKASNRAANLCKQMLAYSGRGKITSVPLNLSELAREMHHMLEVSISKRAVVKYNLVEVLPAIEADPSQLQQVIMNLILNASEAIGERSGIISIATGAMECDRNYLASTYLDEDLPEGVYTYIEIADTGVGMDATVQSKIFDPFFTTKFVGRGLGMSAVLGIVRGHRGVLKIYSEAGHGTTIKVLFPATRELLEGKKPSTATVPIQWPGSATVLLVDDEETLRAVGKKMLERLGLAVITANDGREAVEKYKRHARQITLVLMDLTMPHMDGAEAFRELRRLKSDLPVIVVSGYNEKEVTQQFIGKGLAGFIQKPYRMATLKDKLLQVLATLTPSQPGRAEAAADLDSAPE